MQFFFFFLLKKQINAKIAENAQKQLACQQRQREERQKSMKEHVDKERANLAAYEEQLKVGPREQDSEGLQVLGGTSFF